MNTALLSTTYFGPVQWYQKLNRYSQIRIEACESYQKQTYRNRCIIATTQGTQILTVPVEKASQIRDVRISEHGAWRHLHWHALLSAYGESPFFEYFADDIRPFFEHRWDWLLDFNEAIVHTMCELLDIHPKITRTQTFTSHGKPSDCDDFRETIRPKHTPSDPHFLPRPYYQVYQHKHDFLPNLSILDLLFNMGNESIFYL